MGSNSNPVEKHIVFCNCQGSNTDRTKTEKIKQYLQTLPVRVTVLSDFCGLAATKAGSLNGLFSEKEEVIILACHRRTMTLLFESISSITGELPAPAYINHINSETEYIENEINKFLSSYSGRQTTTEISEDSGWPSWYPVIDYNRCTACGQCADFCLFEVYEKTPGRVNVINPHGCKNQCPACARICPATAIIFPKYKNGGAIGGSDNIDEQSENDRRAKDVENILGNDIYTTLRNREIKRRSIIKEEAMKKALAERENMLKQSGMQKI